MIQWDNNLFLSALSRYVGRTYRWGMYTEKHKQDGRPDYQNPEYIEYRDLATDDMEKWFEYAETITTLLDQANDLAIRHNFLETGTEKDFVNAVASANEMFQDWCEELRSGIGCRRG